MKQYLIDTLSFKDYEILKKILDKRYGEPELSSIYWVPLPENLYTEVQAEHKDCGPFVVAVELRENQLSCEFLVRSRKIMRCSCISYAFGRQRLWVLDLVDELLLEAGLIV